MTLTHPVELICSAIATQEGWFSSGSIPSVRRNPGDLRYSAQVGATRPDGSFGVVRQGTEEPIAVLASNGLGVAAIFRQVWLEVAHGQTVRQIINSWAPPSQNDTSAYLQNVLSWTGLPADIPVLELLPPLTQMNWLKGA